MDIHIFSATSNDIDDMSLLSKAKRLAYEKIQPIFWSYAGPEGDEIQKAWFKELLNNPEYLLLIAKDSKHQCLGFVIGRLIQSPEVYKPGGLTLLIDDFCVLNDSLWLIVGSTLVQEIKKLSKTKGATQVVVVCGAHDSLKAQLLKSLDLSIVSNWFAGTI